MTAIIQAVTHQCPHRKHERHEFSHLTDGREHDRVPVHGTGHPHDMEVEPRQRPMHHEPDDSRGRLPGAAVDQRIRAHVGPK